MPEWLVKFIRRLMGLSEGRYQVTLTIQKDAWDWTITELGKVERIDRC